MKVWWILEMLLISAVAARGDVTAAWPVAPQQEAAWQLPEGMGDPGGRITQLVESLFEVGMPDPRGLDYRYVTVVEGGKSLEARGWVLPKQPGRAGRFAIGWNGLIFPVAAVGERTDLQKDIKILRKKGRFEEEPFDNYQDEFLQDLVARFGSSARMMHPSAAAILLLRLGEQVDVTSSPDDPFAREDEEDQGLALRKYSSDHQVIERLFDYAGAIRSDGVAAFYDHQDRVAAERLTLFDRVWAKAMAGVSPEDRTVAEPDPFVFPDRVRIPDMNPAWREILLDARRRLEERGPQGGSEIEIAIARWEDFESWDDKAWPEVFRQVVAAGAGAIRPLLKVLESDRRWTRAAVEDDDLPQKPLRVADLAIVALEQVLDFNLIEDAGWWSMPQAAWYDEVSQIAKAFCDRYHDQTGAELWYLVLKDEQASLQHQTEAAYDIVFPREEERDFYLFKTFFIPSVFIDRYDRPRSSREGALLRDRRDPSVTSLLVKLWKRSRNHVDGMLAAGEPEVRFLGFPGASPGYFRFQTQLMVRCLEEWEPGNLAVLKQQFTWLEDGLWNLEDPDALSAEWLLLRACEEILIRRFWSDDATAMTDYQRLWRTSLREDASLPTEVIIHFSNPKGMDDLIAEAFLGEEAKLNFGRAQWTIGDQRGWIIQHGRSLLNLPSFRKALLEGLRNRKTQAVLFQEEGVLKAEFLADRDREAQNFYPNAPLRRKDLVNEKIELRMCDLVADALTPGYGSERWLVPDFRLDDPVARRDEAIEAWVKVLEAER